MLFGKNINKYYLKYLHYIIIGIIALVFVDIYQLKIPEIIGGLVKNINEKTLTSDIILQYTKEMILIVLGLLVDLHGVYVFSEMVFVCKQI